MNKILIVIVVIFACVLPCLALELNYSKRYVIDKVGDGYLVKINHPWPKTNITFEYLLYPRGLKIPKRYETLNIVRTPLKKVVTQSTAMLPFIEKLGQLKKLVGVDNKKYINSPSVSALIKQGKIKEVGGSNNINIEKLYILKPDCVLTYGTVYTAMNNYSILNKAGISNIVMATYTEESLLGRSEWIKLFGILFDKTDEANKLFSQIEDKYKKELSLIKSSQKKPTVFCNIPYGSVWHMPSGRTWIADVIAAAGGDYLWKNDKSTMGALKLNTESVYIKAINADIWLGPSHQKWNTYRDIEQSDSRFKYFKSFKTKKIFLNNKRLNKNGGNDIFEKGMVEPHLILRDVANIISGNAKQADLMTFYQAVP